MCIGVQKSQTHHTKIDITRVSQLKKMKTELRYKIWQEDITLRDIEQNIYYIQVMILLHCISFQYKLTRG